MTTEYATSADGLTWTWHGTALSGTPGRWDSRGTRVSAVRFDGDAITAYYDGRASAAENYEERTGVATGSDAAALTAVGDPAARRLALPRRRPALPGHRAAAGRTAPALLRDDEPDGSHALFTNCARRLRLRSGRPFLAWPCPVGLPPTIPPSAPAA